MAIYGRDRYEKMKVYTIAGKARKYRNLFLHSSLIGLTLRRGSFAAVSLLIDLIILPGPLRVWRPLRLSIEINYECDYILTRTFCKLNNLRIYPIINSHGNFLTFFPNSVHFKKTHAL